RRCGELHRPRRDDPPRHGGRRPTRLRDRDRRHRAGGTRARRGRGGARRSRRRVSCAFDLDHYRELLDAAGGYRWTFFDEEPRAGDLFLRHDVDMSLEAALEMAELEAERGVQGTYFLMTRSGFYTLGTRQGDKTLHTLREEG